MKLTKHPLASEDVQRGVPQAANDLALAKRLRANLDLAMLQGDALSEKFYARLFAAHPAVRAMFPADMAAQKMKLAQTLDWVVTNLDKPQDVRPAVKALGVKHDGYGAKPEHYPAVRDALVATLAEITAAQWTRELAADWTTAIDLLSEMMMRRS